MYIYNTSISKEGMKLKKDVGNGYVHVVYKFVRDSRRTMFCFLQTRIVNSILFPRSILLGKDFMDYFAEYNR